MPGRELNAIGTLLSCAFVKSKRFLKSTSRGKSASELECQGVDVVSPRRRLTVGHQSIVSTAGDTSGRN
jgi:hypothetical protein